MEALGLETNHKSFFFLSLSPTGSLIPDIPQLTFANSPHLVISFSLYSAKRAIQEAYQSDWNHKSILLASRFSFCRSIIGVGGTEGYRKLNVLSVQWHLEQATCNKHDGIGSWRNSAYAAKDQLFLWLSAATDATSKVNDSLRKTADGGGGVGRCRELSSLHPLSIFWSQFDLWSCLQPTSNYEPGTYGRDDYSK